MRHPLIAPAELNGWKIQLILIALAMIFVPAVAFVKSINRSNEGPIYQSNYLLLSPLAIIAIVLCLMSDYWMRMLLVGLLAFCVPFIYFERKQTKYDAWVKKLLHPRFSEEERRT